MYDTRYLQLVHHGMRKSLIKTLTVTMNSLIGEA